MAASKKKCAVCDKKFSLSLLYPLELTRESIWKLISEELPRVSREGYICPHDHHKFRRKHIEAVLQEDRGKLTDLEQDVINSLEKHAFLTENINEAYEDSLSLGERVADKISSFGGSWKFIFAFLGFLFGWMILNTLILLQDQYDPYPYILLNLILSCLAAIQAPIIMMSQNRRGERDRIQAENDYKVNLKSELQIRQLNTKIEKYMSLQWNRLQEIQKIQGEILEELDENSCIKGK